MRTLPSGLQAHLDAGATTLAWCWRITRADGTKMGFTDHDEDLVFDGTTFEAASGFTASDIESSVGLSVDNLDVEGALKSDRLREADLEAGLYDNAVIEILRVNWQDTSQRILMRYGNLGEVTRGRLSFRAEVRGLAHVLQQPKGRLFQNGCDADLGDSRCTVALAGLTYAGTVETASSRRLFTASGAAVALATDFFSRGLLTWATGDNAGRKAQVKLHTLEDGVATFELWERAVDDIADGDTFNVAAGCDKQFETCRVKFANQANFRGFPHMPGNDFAISYPNSDDPENDGGSMQA